MYTFLIERRRVLAAYLSALAVIAIPGALPAHAQHFFETPRQFIVDKPCTAYRSFKRLTDPQPLVVGQSYVARGVNRPDAPTHVFLRIGRVERWVALSCGRYADAAAADHSVAPSVSGSASDPAPSAAADQCLPFFDFDNNPVNIGFGGRVDITPPPPTLDAFDFAINETCGAPGKQVGEAEFKALFLAHPDVLARLQAFTSDRVFADRPPQTDAAAYLDQLAEAWLSIKAFDHIMCGEPGTGRNTIGGLHFHGRYLQLQASRQACRMPNYRQNEAVPGVLYTFGVVMRTPGGGLARHATKGYGLTLSGEDLFKVITRGFAENPTTSTSSSACLLAVEDDGRSFTAVFVRRRTGIRTFYPDGTPSKRDPACAHPIKLQEKELARDAEPR